MSEAAPHPHNKVWFYRERKEIYNFVKNLKVSIAAKKRLLLLVAPVKAGKREITECIKNELPDYTGYYLTSLNRKDVKNQQEELEKYNIQTCVISRDDIVAKLIININKEISKGKKIILFWDECDYGSGKNQKLNGIFQIFVDNENVVHCLISATAHETMFSSLAERKDFAILEYVPPEAYKGAKYFLENNLVFKAKPFIERESDISPMLRFTDHAFDVMRESITSLRNIGGVRITAKGITTESILQQIERLEESLNTHFGNSLSGRPIKIKVIDANHELNWEDKIIRRGYTCQPIDTTWLFIFNQTCTRGTDLKGWHPNLGFWHDARSCKTCNLNTLLQAILRPSHYANSYIDGVSTPTPQPIRLYADLAAVKAATGDFTDYKKEKGKAPTRMTKTRNFAEYETHEENTYDALKRHFDEIEQQLPPLSSFPKQGEFYKPLKALGINEADRAREVWDYENAKRLKFQENRLNKYYIIPSYTTEGDSSSLVWIITRKLTKQQADKKNPFQATSKSMYDC
jgi:hypothetical protein